MLEINKENFEKEIMDSEKPTVLDFWAKWCPPCKMLGPIFEELSKEMSEFKFAKIDVDKNQEIAGQFEVRSIPTLIFFKDKKEIGRMTGFLPKEI